MGGAQSKISENPAQGSHPQGFFNKGLGRSVLGVNKGCGHMTEPTSCFNLYVAL